jgi:hypothetical protein
MGLFYGKPEKFQQLSTLNKGQQGLQSQLLASLQGQGAGGAFGDIADYYRSLMDPSSDAARAFEAPMMREYNEDIIPGLAEQFAGMGSGAMSSSGFQNAAMREGTNLAERLAAMRQGLRQQGAQGLGGLTMQGMQPTVENVHRPATSGFLPGLLQAAAPGIGMALGSALGPAGAAVGGAGASWLTKKFFGGQ